MRCMLARRSNARSAILARMFALTISAAVPGFFPACDFESIIPRFLSSRRVVAESNGPRGGPKERPSSREYPVAARVTMQNAHLSASLPLANCKLISLVFHCPVSRADSAWVNPRCAKQCRRSSSIIYRLYASNGSAPACVYMCV